MKKQLVIFDKVLEVDPKDPVALYNKGVMLSTLGRYQEAMTWYDKALAVDPKMQTL